MKDFTKKDFQREIKRLVDAVEIKRLEGCSLYEGDELISFKCTGIYYNTSYNYTLEQYENIYHKLNKKLNFEK